jgi:transcriptional regulator with GAF, ATPase, and Fis domain
MLRYEGSVEDITGRVEAEAALRQRNRELDLLNRAAQALNVTLDLDRVLATILEEVRRLLDVLACSVWLIDPESDELVCRQVTGPQSEVVRGWRLAPGEGLAGWVARSGESLIVPDARADARHFRGVDRQTGLALRSILSLPLRVRQDVIGVLQVVDTEVGRFDAADLVLLEPLAASAARAVENARLYEQAQHEIAERVRAQEALQVSHRLLKIANQHTEMIPLFKEFVAQVKNFTGCAAVGIRILDEKGNIPYQAYEGFSRSFYESESPLSIKSDQCMCINVIKGGVDPKLPFYTKKAGGARDERGPGTFGDVSLMVDELTVEELPADGLQVTLVKWRA